MITRTTPVLPVQGLKTKIFAKPRDPGKYLFKDSELSHQPRSRNICIPLVVDTEYQAFLEHWLIARPQGRLPLTTQMKGIKNDTGLILASPRTDPRVMELYPVAKSGFHPVDYLAQLGHQVELRRVTNPDTLKGLPQCEFVLYAHFALVEAMMIVDDVGDDTYHQDFLNLFKAKEPAPRFEMQRRLAARTGSGARATDNVSLPWVLTLDGTDYAVQVAWVDTFAIHGVASYAAFCAASGIKLSAKDTFSAADKANMLETCLKRNEEFNKYALGDLEVYAALEANAEKFRHIYQALGVARSFVEPKLTIGGTIKNLFTAVVMANFNESDPKVQRKLIDNYIAPGSSEILSVSSTDTRALLAKVEGGRCRNNQPTTINYSGALMDTDIGGAYGEGQRNQTYFAGVPVIVSWDARSDRNEYWTLKEFLKQFKGELVPGCWMARVSTQKPLRYAQDFFASWFLPSGHGEDILAKYVAKQMKSDTENQETDETTPFDVEDGNLKIFRHEILNGVLNHDGLQWIENVCSSRQRKELLENLYIKAAIVYPKSCRVDTVEEFDKAQKEHRGKNTRHIKRRGKTAQLIAKDGECHAWMGFNIGELIVDDLLANRKLYPKKTPLNILFKLCTNTLYGDMVSRYFLIANICAGNNITARCRALAYYMEKGLNGFQTITDGCAFDLNRVVYPKINRQPNASDFVNLYSNKCSNLKFGAIDGADKITLEWRKYLSNDETVHAPTLVIERGANIERIETTLIPDIDRPGQFLRHNPEGCEPMLWANAVQMKHLQSLFPSVDVLHSESTSLKPSKDEATGQPIKNFVPRLGQFIIEGKDFYDNGTFHGTSNYVLRNPNVPNLKMRSYETKRPHESVILNDGKLEISERYGAKQNPATDLMAQLKANPTAIERQAVFAKQAILKPGDYRNHPAKWEALGLEPGDSYIKPGLLREFSLSQFTFDSWQQWKAWDKAYTRRKDKYSQSFEMFFENPDGTLDYKSMVNTIDRLIREGCIDPIAALDRNENIYRKEIEHSQKQTLLAVKEHLYG